MHDFYHYKGISREHGKIDSGIKINMLIFLYFVCFCICIAIFQSRPWSTYVISMKSLQGMLGSFLNYLNVHIIISHKFISDLSEV